MAALSDSLAAFVTPDAVRTVASRLGESEAAVAYGLDASLSSVLAGLVTGDAGVIRRAFTLITSGDAAGPSDIGALARGMSSEPLTAGLSRDFLSALFGGRTSQVADVIGRTAGLTRPSSSTSILGLAAPIVLGFLSKRVRDSGMGIGAFSKTLAAERADVLVRAPIGLRSILDVPPAIVFQGAPPGSRRGAQAAASVRPPESSGQRRWVWPLVAMSAIALLWVLLGRDGSPQPVAVAIDSAVMSAPGPDSSLAPAALTVDTAAGLVATSARDLGTIAKRTLASGVVLNVTERGIESSLIAFIDDSSRPVNDTTWFEFDRLNFATSSATILPESQEQLGNIAAILDAYPNVTVKIGGYTDNSGDRAANKRLSQQRAQAVRLALVDKGIAPSRMVAEGYGDAHPVADNASEDGRARNRRIAVRVTSK